MRLGGGHLAERPTAIFLAAHANQVTHGEDIGRRCRPPANRVFGKIGAAWRIPLSHSTDPRLLSASKMATWSSLTSVTTAGEGRR